MEKGGVSGSGETLRCLVYGRGRVRPHIGISPAPPCVGGCSFHAKGQGLSILIAPMSSDFIPNSQPGSRRKFQSGFTVFLVSILKYPIELRKERSLMYKTFCVVASSDKLT